MPWSHLSVDQLVVEVLLYEQSSKAVIRLCHMARTISRSPFVKSFLGSLCQTERCTQQLKMTQHRKQKLVCFFQPKGLRIMSLRATTFIVFAHVQSDHSFLDHVTTKIIEYWLAKCADLGLNRHGSHSVHPTFDFEALVYTVHYDKMIT
jgi:hypothetical protein